MNSVIEMAYVDPFSSEMANVDQLSSEQEREYLQGRTVPGYVIVIVNHEFEHAPDLPRGNDGKKIKELFSQYGYEVRCFYNLNKRQILATVSRYSQKDDSASLIYFISSHGTQTSLECPNGISVEISDILKTAETKELELCPKVFFIDACRSINGSLDGKILPEPPTSNYYVGFSCLDTKISYVGTDSCGVYIEKIIQIFKTGFRRKHVENEKVRDLNHFMNKVHYAVTKEYHQVPTVRTTLVGKIFFQAPQFTEEVPINTPCFY